MIIECLKSKIHRVTITQANVNYVGSITIDKSLMEAANIICGEKVQVVNVTNGERLETYAIEGEAGSGVICLNGAALVTINKEDFEAAKEFKPWVIFPDTATNKLVK